MRRERLVEQIVPALRNVTFHVPRGTVLGVDRSQRRGQVHAAAGCIAGSSLQRPGRIVVRGRLGPPDPGPRVQRGADRSGEHQARGPGRWHVPERLADLTDEIAEFAQLGEYIDFPMRTYSSRHADAPGFAVAVFLDPEMLLIDEALTGGDAAFQERVAEKIAQLTGEGRTIVLVTHGLSTVRTMATEAMWLHQGQVAEFGDPDEVVAKYMRYCRHGVARHGRS